MRINKFLAECGVCSRRQADQLVLSGRVTVGGKKVTQLGYDVQVGSDIVYVDGKRVRPVSRYTYLMLYKPKGCICSRRDEKGRKTVYDYVKMDKKLDCVGRLDYDSEGLLLLTNDGELLHRLTHPGFAVPKTYLVKVEGEVQPDHLQQWRKGVQLDDGQITAPAKVTPLGYEDKHTRLEIIIREGKNREIRRMAQALGLNVVFLKRTAIGDLKLGGLGRGASRFLSDKEVAYLHALTQQ